MGNEFKNGDVVVLKSGGPAMTIEEIKDNKCKCQWFKDNSLKYNYFLVHSLENVSSKIKTDKNSSRFVDRTIKVR